MVVWNAGNKQFLGDNIPAELFVISTFPLLSEVGSMNRLEHDRTLSEEHSWSNVGQPLGWLWGWRGCKDHTADSSDYLDALVSGLGPRTICLQKLQEPWRNWQLDFAWGKMMKDYDDPLDPLDSTQFSDNSQCVKWQ